MGKLVSTVLFLFIFLTAGGKSISDTTFTLYGKIEGYGNGTIVISHTNPNERVPKDTIQVINDEFIFKGKLQSPIISYLLLLNNGKLKSDYYRFDFLMENSEMFLTGNISDAKNFNLTGSKSYDFYKLINSDASAIIKKLVDFRRVVQAAEKNQTKVPDSVLKAYDLEKNTYVEFLTNHDGFYFSHAGAYRLWLFMKNISWQKLDTIISKFDQSLQDNIYLVYMKKKVASEKSILPGNDAADFTVMDLSGKPYSLKDFRGQFFLMTFSASWCVPCKLEYPFLRKAYEKYAGKGLKMIIMNVDDSRDKWEGDVKKYDFPFPVLSNLEAFNGGLTKNYGVLSIPKIFLIDPEGKIVSATLRQQGIMDKLDEIYH